MNLRCLYSFPIQLTFFRAPQGRRVAGDDDDDATADSRGDELLDVLSSPNSSNQSNSRKKHARNDHSSNSSGAGGGDGDSLDMEQGRPSRQDYV